MGLQLQGYIELPEHRKPGGFDHAAIHQATGRLYAAHTVNDALDVIDCNAARYLHSIPNLSGVAGVLVSEERRLVFTSNRADNTVGIFSPEDETAFVKVPVGIRPNGLAHDPGRNVLLVANVGDPAIPNSYSVSIVDVSTHTLTASIPVAGRTRWAIFDEQTDAFYINIASPAQIIVVNGAAPTHIAKTLPVPAAGPHGLDSDGEGRHLFCACDAGKLVVVAIQSGAIVGLYDLSGVPDVIFFNKRRKHLYIAVGDPGVIDVFDTTTYQRIETALTEKGTHTLAFDAVHDTVYAFLPQTHRAAVYQDDR